MDMSSSMTMMSGVFTTTTTTPLYSASWTPSSTGTYAATCIFLIVLASIHRGLYVVFTIFSQAQQDRAQNRRYVVVAGETPEAEKIRTHEDGKLATLVSERGEEKVVVVKSGARPVLPWRVSSDLPRAALVTVIVGVGYLLMLAVMTLNVGYFLSVLGGTFLGDCAIGRHSRVLEH